MKPELQTVSDKLGRQWCDSFSLHERDGRLYLSTAFVLQDGDALPVVIDFDRHRHVWLLSDQGRATSHLEYLPAPLTDGRRRRIANMVENWGGQYDNGTVTTEFDRPPGAYDVADFMQLVVAIAALPLQDVPPRVQNFRTIVRGSVESWLPPNVERTEQWHHEASDPQAGYPVDLRIWRPNDVPVDSFYVATREPIERAIGTLWHLRYHHVDSQPLVVHRALDDSPSLYRLDLAARETGAMLVAVHGEPDAPSSLVGVRNALTTLKVPLKKPLF